MKFRSILCQTTAVMLLGSCMFAGCSAPTADTGPAEEPNIGPGVAAGGPPAVTKGAATKATTAGPASTKDAKK